MENVGRLEVGKKARILKKDFKGGVGFEFPDGEVIECRIEELGEAMLERLVQHGIKDKVGDSYSACKGDMEASKAKVKAIWAALTSSSPSWTLGGGGGNGGILALALSRVLGEDLPTILEKLEGKTKGEKKELEKNARVAREILVIKKERLEAEQGALGDEGEEDLIL